MRLNRFGAVSSSLTDPRLLSSLSLTTIMELDILGTIMLATPCICYNDGFRMRFFDLYVTFIREPGFDSGSCPNVLETLFRY